MAQTSLGYGDALFLRTPFKYFMCRVSRSGDQKKLKNVRKKKKPYQQTLLERRVLKWLFGLVQGYLLPKPFLKGKHCFRLLHRVTSNQFRFISPSKILRLSSQCTTMHRIFVITVHRVTSSQHAFRQSPFRFTCIEHNYS